MTIDQNPNNGAAPRTERSGQPRAIGAAGPLTGEAQHLPPASLMWEELDRTAQERLQGYREFVRHQLQELSSQQARLGAAGLPIFDRDTGEFARLHAAQRWANSVCAEEFCERGSIRQRLGRNFLGAQEWRSIGIEVGPVPFIPAILTAEFLETECPLFPGEKIGDTHMLVLVPETIYGQPYSALALDRLCQSRTGSGRCLINDAHTSWKEAPWAFTPQGKSEWVFLAKGDPDEHPAIDGKLDRHFRGKSIAEQDAVHKTHYPHHREVATVELLTGMILRDLVHGAPRMLDGWGFLRCRDAGTRGGQVYVGCFDDSGVIIRNVTGDNQHSFVGRGLARILGHY